MLLDRHAELALASASLDHVELETKHANDSVSAKNENVGQQRAISASDESISGANICKKAALVIANATYDASGTSLRLPIRDAERMAEALQATGFHVICVLDEPSVAAVEAECQRFLALVGPETECAWVYYSGHAMQASAPTSSVAAATASASGRLGLDGMAVVVKDDSSAPNNK